MDSDDPRTYSLQILCVWQDTQPAWNMVCSHLKHLNFCSCPSNWPSFLRALRWRETWTMLSENQNIRIASPGRFQQSPFAVNMHLYNSLPFLSLFMRPCQLVSGRLLFQNVNKALNRCGVNFFLSSRKSALLPKLALAFFLFTLAAFPSRLHRRN